MPEQQGDKSQEATPHRRRQAREEGQVPKSQDLGSAILLILGILALWMLGGRLIDYLGAMTRRQLGEQAWLSAEPEFAAAEWNRAVFELAQYALPLMAVMLLGAVAVHVSQTGPLFLPQKLLPDLTRLDPIKGVGRLVSLPNLMRLLFGLFKIAVIATVAMVSLYQRRHDILGMTGMEVGPLGAMLVELLLGTALRVGVALLILAILDYAFQRWKYEQDIRMTTQEVREELKNLEGNPQVLARRRVVQRQLALNRLSEAVPKADVVITNPTELAVAIQYDPEKMAAPVVVAKGAGLVAERIRRLALERNIPVVERKPLAQALFREVDVNHPIPEDKYAAVAEVLAYVYQLKGKTLGAGGRGGRR
jgi:flagellar biosynthesis protein FlhB